MNSILISKWRQESATENGKPIDEGEEIILVLQERHFSVTRNGAIDIEGTFLINSNQSEIDWHDTTGPDAGKTFKAICRFERDTFAFSAADEGQARPVGFEEIQGHTVRRFRRQY